MERLRSSKWGLFVDERLLSQTYSFILDNYYKYNIPRLKVHWNAYNLPLIVSSSLNNHNLPYLTGFNAALLPIRNTTGSADRSTTIPCQWNSTLYLPKFGYYDSSKQSSTSNRNRRWGYSKIIAYTATRHPCQHVHCPQTKAR